MDGAVDMEPGELGQGEHQAWPLAGCTMASEALAFLSPCFSTCEVGTILLPHRVL